MVSLSACENPCLLTNSHLTHVGPTDLVMWEGDVSSTHPWEIDRVHWLEVGTPQGTLGHMLLLSKYLNSEVAE